VCRLCSFGILSRDSCTTCLDKCGLETVLCSLSKVFVVIVITCNILYKYSRSSKYLFKWLYRGNSSDFAVLRINGLISQAVFNL
jgi:hypothetical protein